MRHVVIQFIRKTKSDELCLLASCIADTEGLGHFGPVVTMHLYRKCGLSYGDKCQALP